MIELDYHILLLTGWWSGSGVEIGAIRQARKAISVIQIIIFNQNSVPKFGKTVLQQFHGGTQQLKRQGTHS